MSERSTKAQVQAYRVGVRRIEHALATGSGHQPPGSSRRGMPMIIGLVVSGLLVAGFAVYGFIRPAPAVGDARVLVDTDSGGAFVVRDGVAHPALNLASAMLAAVDDDGGASTVRKVNGATLADLPKGPLVGIPGAPSQVPSEDDLAPNTWTVCDLAEVDPAAPPSMVKVPTTSVLIGAPQPVTDPDPDFAMLVTTDGADYSLVWAGHRARITDPRDRALIEGLGLDLDTARRVSTSLLNSIPESAPLEVPDVVGAGDPVALGGVALSIGDVLTVRRAAGDTFYVVLGDGIQPISAGAADLLLARTSAGAGARELSPAALSAMPETERPLDLTAVPPTRPAIVDQEALPALCVDWRLEDGKAHRALRAVASLPLPSGAQPVPAPPQLEAQKGVGTADAVYLPAQQGLVVGQSIDGTAAGTGNLFLVTDQGVKYPVASPTALSALGLGARISPAPAALVALLPLGPTLDLEPARRLYGGAGTGG